MTSVAPGGDWTTLTAILDCEHERQISFIDNRTILKSDQLIGFDEHPLRHQGRIHSSKAEYRTVGIDLI